MTIDSMIVELENRKKNAPQGGQTEICIKSEPVEDEWGNRFFDKVEVSGFYWETVGDQTVLVVED